LFDPITQGKKIGDFTEPIVMMTTKDLRTSNTYYIVSAGPGRDAFADWSLSVAVAASGSAPIYFPPVGGNFVDGGVGVFGNPCLAGAIEAIDYIKFPESQTLLMSLGTGYVADTVPDGGGGNFWLKDWVEYLILEGIDDSSLQQVDLTRRLYKKLDFRRYNPYLERASVRDALGIDTSGGIDPASLGLDSHRPEEIALMEQIGRAYARKLDWTKPNVLPWETVGGHPQPGILPMDWSKTEYR
jgi:hypothetical protein